MQDRRQSTRFVLSRALEGLLKVLDNVVVERYVGDEIVVLASIGAKPKEMLTVDRLVAGNSSRVEVRVIESGPAVVDGQLKHRIRLRVNGNGGESRPRVLGGLVKTVHASLVDISEGGCQIECATPVENGLCAELEIAFNDGVRSEPVRVCRCRMVPGAGPVFRIGAQFRVTTAAGYSFRERLIGGADSAGVRLL